AVDDEAALVAPDQERRARSLLVAAGHLELEAGRGARSRHDRPAGRDHVAGDRADAGEDAALHLHRRGDRPAEEPRLPGVLDVARRREAAGPDGDLAVVAERLAE